MYPKVEDNTHISVLLNKKNSKLRSYLPSNDPNRENMSDTIASNS